MKIKIKRLFNGLVSIRDYQWRNAGLKKEDITIEYKGQQMTIPWNREAFQVHTRRFMSKYGGSYELVDFPFVVDKQQKQFNFKEER